MEAEFGKINKYFICDVFTIPTGNLVPDRVGSLYLTTHYIREEQCCETHIIEGQCCRSNKMKAFMLRKGHFKIFKIGKDRLLEITISLGNELKNTELLEYCPYTKGLTTHAVYTLYHDTIYQTASQAKSAMCHGVARDSYHVINVTPSKSTGEEGGFAIMHRIPTPVFNKCPSSTFVSFVPKEGTLDYNAKYCCPADFSSKSFEVGPDCFPLNYITKDQKSSKTIVCYHKPTVNGNK